MGLAKASLVAGVYTGDHQGLLGVGLYPVSVGCAQVQEGGASGCPDPQCRHRQGGNGEWQDVLVCTPRAAQTQPSSLPRAVHTHVSPSQALLQWMSTCESAHTHTHTTPCTQQPLPTQHTAKDGSHKCRKGLCAQPPARGTPTGAPPHLPRHCCVAVGVRTTLVTAVPWPGLNPKSRVPGPAAPRSLGP